MLGANFGDITKTEPEKSLLKPLNKKAGRNNRANSPYATAAVVPNVVSASWTSSETRLASPAG